MGEVILTGFVEIPASDRPEILPLLAEHIVLTRAEPGCLAFDVSESAERSGWFAVAERFRDTAAFEAHQARATASAWGIATRHLRRDAASSFHETAVTAADVLTALEAAASEQIRADMAPRYGIVTPMAMGVPMAAMQRIAKPLAPDHALAAALWATGWYEARTTACLIDDPTLVTAAQMNHWRADFDNWAIVDTACFKLFDRVSGAAAMVEPWTQLDDAFGRRAGFALLACLALHGRAADFARGLALVESAATDERNFVKKAVAWALKAIGGKADATLRAEARALAARLAASADRTARWIGKDAARAFARPTRSTP